MARARQGKDAKLKSSSSRKNGSSKTSGASDVLKAQIEALGGSAEDYDLVKDAEKLPAAVSEADTALLTKDVRNFMKGLNLDTAAPEKKQDSKGKSKADSPKKASNNSFKQKQPVSNDEPAVTAPPPEPSSSKPKTVLPSKVSLNPKSRFTVQPTAHWHTALPKLPPSKTPVPAPTAAQLESLATRISRLHADDISTFLSSSSSGSSASEASFLTKIISSGTLSDRLSALTLLVQSSPLHNIKSLETLRSMAERGKGKGGREESLKALRCIVDWWVGGGAPDRKLKYFRDQPILHPAVNDEILLLWYFEDWLKKYFFSILQILETLSLDTLPYVRTQALNLIATLLRDKPEQEQNLLRLLVNKLGDGDKSLCSRASHHLLKVLQVHPSMKSVVVREVTGLVLRPAAAPPIAPPSTPGHIRFNDPPEKKRPAPTPEKKTGNTHARYYSTITFNQVVLSPGDKAVALQLINVYFEIFKELLGEGRLRDDDDAGALEEKEEGAEEEVRKDKKGRVIAPPQKHKGKKYAKEVKGAAGFAEVEDTDSKMISALLTGVNRALPFAKLDSGDKDLQKHIDTLFLITHTSTFNISLQALVLIQQISSSLLASGPSSSSTSTSVVDRYYRTLYTSLHDPRLPTSSKQAMYLNLLFKSIKADATNAERVKALVRRFVQILVSGGNGAAEFVAGGLFLLGELFSTIPGLRSMVNSPSQADAEAYDSKKRDPQYAHASSSPLWELTPLLHHYHPAISLHAKQILSSQPVTANADLSLNTLSHFLDRFVYKNPKKIKEDANGVSVGNATVKAKGSSMMQPAASGLDGTGVKLMKGEVRESGGLVNDAKFLKQRVEDVPVDQVMLFPSLSLSYTDMRSPRCSITSTSHESMSWSRSRPKPRGAMAARMASLHLCLRTANLRVMVMVMVAIRQLKRALITKTIPVSVTLKRRKSGRL
ncbi:hypothetical protein HGRIS_010705 [Hohenbuehelia grisea]|uniref:CCAAT-binding factor domain-containing protein n=1 Tax=Hohenbuehelia grisea TaxID=104357 RepID=A0ABR3IXK9_9AGAR